MFAKFAVSAAVGFLGAYPLASSSGLMGLDMNPNSPGPTMVVVFSGIILFFLTLALIGPTLRLIRQVLDALSQVEERPRPTVAFTMLCLGTLCDISAMLIQLNAGNHPPASVSMNIPGFNGGNNPAFNAAPSMAMQTSGSFGLGVLTIKPPATAIVRIVKPEAPELAEVAS
jgi:hypothetical protein